MTKALHHRNPSVVNLKDKITISTTLPQEQHAALRAGFVGYPMNPRWNVSKYHAWKTGRQLRDDLNQGKLVVRPTDSMLVPLAGHPSHLHPKPLSGPVRPMITWSKNILTAIAIA